MDKLLTGHSHKRYNILTGEWILVSPHRTNRPWQGEVSPVKNEKRNKYEADCYLCPGNKRANGDTNPSYGKTFVFDNDFPSLEGCMDPEEINKGMLRAASETGVCRVVCFSPDHSLSLADMSTNIIADIIRTWQSEYKKLGKIRNINHVQIFENKGEIMGCSNPHPHGQIWAQSSIPNEIGKKDARQKAYFLKNNSSLLGDYLKQELVNRERIVYENDSFVLLVPFWAVWPFETMIIPRDHSANISSLNAKQTSDYADTLKTVTSSYDRIFDTPFPYSAGIHQAPTDGKNYNHWHWHMVFYPPLLRSATIKKFMVGYEFLAMPQRDITPEKAAEKLNSLVDPDIGQ